MIDIYFEDLVPRKQAEILRANDVGSVTELRCDQQPLFEYAPERNNVVDGVDFGLHHENEDDLQQAELEKLEAEYESN